MVLAPHLHMVV
jgi:hypothetical protein